MTVAEANIESPLNDAYLAFSQVNGLYPNAPNGLLPTLVSERGGDRFMPYIPLASSGRAHLIPLEVDVITPPQFAIMAEAVVRFADEPHEKRVTDGRTVKYEADLVLFGIDGVTGQFSVRRTDRSDKEYYLTSTRPELAFKAVELMLKSITHQAQTYIDTMS
jgi:hypothetical protein